MKKLLVINTKYREFGGEDSNIVDELEVLKKNYSIQYIEFDNQNFNVLDLFSIFFGTNPQSVKKLNLAIKSFEPDVVYIHNLWFKAGLGIFKSVSELNIPILHKIHNYRTTCSKYFLARNHLNDKLYCHACNFKKDKLTIFNKYYKDSYLKSFLLIIFSKQYFKLLQTKGLKVIVLSKFHKKYLEKHEVNPKNLFILFNPITRTHLEEIKYSPKSSSVIYAGRQSEEKGINELIQCWIDANIEGIDLKIAGVQNISTKESNDLKKYNIQFIGQLPNEKLQILIKSSRAVVTATKLYEGQPRLLFEALSCSIPTIFPNFGGMPEFFPDNYSFKFDQFDYVQLTNTLKKLNDQKLLMYEHNRLKKLFDEKYSEDLYLSKIDNLISG